MKVTSQSVLSPRRRAFGILAAGLALALPVSGLAAAGAVAQEDKLVLDHGHIDAFNIDADENGNPVLNLKEDVTGNQVRQVPEEVILHVREEAFRALPAEGEPGSVGLPAELHGQEVYFLPLTQDHNLIWPGWDSQSLQGTQWDSVDIVVDAIDGPGDVHLWSNGSWGDLQYLLGGEQTQLPGTIHQSFFAHVHANWAFTQPGEYTFEVFATAHNSNDGSTSSTELHTYTWTVGEYGNEEPIADPLVQVHPDRVTSAELADQGVTITGSQFVPGAEVELHIDGEPKPGTVVAGGDGVVEFVFSASGLEPGEVTLELIAGEQRATASFTVTEDDGGDPEPPRSPSATVEPAELTVEELANSGVTVTGIDFEPGIDVTLRSGTQDVETKPADEDGTVAFTYRAEDVQPGAQSLSLRAGELTVPAPFTVTAGEEPGPAPDPKILSPLERCEAIFPGENQVCLDNGHVDAFYVLPSDSSGVDLRVKEDVTGNGVIRHSDGVGLVVKEEALTTLPSQNAPAEIQGEDVYYLPLTQDVSLLWPGWDSQRLAGSSWGAPVDIEILGIDGPGDVYLWSNGTFGELASLLNGGTYQLPGTITQDFLAHVHANWAFTEPGDYTFTVQATATNTAVAGLPSATTEIESYRFFVGDASLADTEPVPDPGETPQPDPGQDDDNPPADNPPGQTPTAPIVCTPVGDNGGNNGNNNGASVVGADGHFDIGPAVIDGEFQLMVKDDREQPPTWRNPSDIVFQLGDAAFHEASGIPDDLDFISGGGDIYMIGAVQEPDVPWVGWNTQHESIVGSPATITMLSVEGPGDLAVFEGGQMGTFVGNKYFDTVGGPSSYTVPINTHVHTYWIFTEAGNYSVNLQVEVDGQTANGTISFAVGVGAGGGTGEQGDEENGQDENSATGNNGVDQHGNPCVLPRTGGEEIAPAVLYAAIAALMIGGLLLTRRRRRI